MLTSLSIKNYALIDDIHVNFGNGLSIITGETGAGKSIMLGALSLILGKRADLGAVKDTSRKCIIEATFDIANYGLKTFFKLADLDYDASTIIRREILPSGKSRSFVNDSPVNLIQLEQLSAQLIDVHSQHENLKLSENDFQFQVIDALASNDQLLETYQEQLHQLKELEARLQELQEFKSKALREQDYHTFLLEELNNADLIEGELESLEEEQQKLSHVDTLKEHLEQAQKGLQAENYGLLEQLQNVKYILSKITAYGANYHAIYERIESCQIELDDLLSDIESEQEQLNSDPQRLEEVNSKLQLIQNLLLKHSVGSIEALLKIKEDLTHKVATFEHLDEDLANVEKDIEILKSQLDEIAHQLHANRITSIPEFTSALTNILNDLGMPNARFNIEVNGVEHYGKNGKDELSFLFTANKGEQFKTLKKVASGGELSRIMLAVKSILCKYTQLPSIIFDEVDTGVSGEISNKMADIMKQMSSYMQVITITHLPQIAAKGDVHYKVYKEDLDTTTTTKLMKLNDEDRIVEIAEMLGGKSTTASAVAHAKQLLN